MFFFFFVKPLRHKGLLSVEELEITNITNEQEQRKSNQDDSG